MRLLIAKSLVLAALLFVHPAVAQDEETLRAALFTAARDNDHDLAAYALERGAAPDSLNQYGNTPLQVTAIYGSPAVAELLLERGADPATATPVK